MSYILLLIIFIAALVLVYVFNLKLYYSMAKRRGIKPDPNYWVKIIVVMGLVLLGIFLVGFLKYKTGS